MTGRIFARLALAAALVAFAFFVRTGAPDKAEAQGVSVSVEFRTALEPHGRWHRHDRFGEVWIPAKRDRDWRPYTRGHWVYTEDWGWYWIAANEESEWGWVTYHYGRWYRDREAGWVWIPGNEWGPAWVSWRRGNEEVGWAALPPDDVIVEYEDEPEVWIFVRARDVIAPSIVRVVLPRNRVTVLVRETVVVNRTRFVSGARVAANVGVPPSYLRVQVPVSRVRPVVLRGTAQVSGAIEVDAKAKGDRRARRAEVQKAGRSIQPAKDVPKAERFEQGKTQNTPDAPKVLQQAQPQQQPQTPSTDQKTDQKKDDVTPKAQPQKNGTQPKQDTKQKDEPKQKREEPQPKAQPQKQETPKAKQEKQEKQDDTKSRQQNDQPKQTPKRDERPDNLQKKNDEPRGEQKQNREQKQDASPKAVPSQQKQEMQPKAGPQQKEAPQRQDGPAQGPGRMEKKDN
jgi:hypothetical protein